MKSSPTNDAAQLAIAAERAQRRLIGYPSVDRARPLNQRVMSLGRELNGTMIRRPKQQLAALLLMLFCLDAALAGPKQRSLSGTFVYYEGGSGGGTIGLLIGDRIQKVMYSEPIKWTGLSAEDDVWYGAKWTVSFGKGRHSQDIVAIHNSGQVDQNVRAVWQLVVTYYTHLKNRECDAAYELLDGPLREAVSPNLLCEASEHVTYDIKPFDTVQPNPLSRYGILIYGMKIVRWTKHEAIVFLRSDKFIAGDTRLFVVRIADKGSGYKIRWMGEIDDETYSSERVDEDDL